MKEVGSSCFWPPRPRKKAGPSSQDWPCRRHLIILSPRRCDVFLRALWAWVLRDLRVGKASGEKQIAG